MSYPRTYRKHIKRDNAERDNNDEDLYGQQANGNTTRGTRFWEQSWEEKSGLVIIYKGDA